MFYCLGSTQLEKETVQNRFSMRLLQKEVSCLRCPVFNHMSGQDLCHCLSMCLRYSVCIGQAVTELNWCLWWCTETLKLQQYYKDMVRAAFFFFFYFTHEWLSSNTYCMFSIWHILSKMVFSSNNKMCVLQDVMHKTNSSQNLFHALHRE